MGNLPFYVIAYLAGSFALIGLLASLFRLDRRHLSRPIGFVRHIFDRGSGVVDIASPIYGMDKASLAFYRLIVLGVASLSQIAVIRVATDSNLLAHDGDVELAMGAIEIVAFGFTTLWLLFDFRRAARLSRVGGGRR